MIGSLANDFREGMSRLAGGVTIVAARGPAGDPFGLTATSVCSLTAEPPALLVCVSLTSSLARHLAMGVPFTVNVLAPEQEDVARAFAGLTTRRGPERFDCGNWHSGWEDQPELAGAPAVFCCRVDALIERSTHLLVTGEVAQVRTLDGPSAPLVHHARTFTTTEAIHAT